MRVGDVGVGEKEGGDWRYTEWNVVLGWWVVFFRDGGWSKMRKGRMSKE